ncbi:FAD binding domain-containing protein [Prauserella sp. PE36]|uniref:FAD binding domain-containing protein n=1 Tax=Prauserella sp. PE36 TaxID=1504709 RepID=UPI0018F43634
MHTSDLCVALAATGASVELTGPDRGRVVSVTEFYREPGDTPHVENVVRGKEVITAVEVPALPEGARSTYRKVRDRASYTFALVSVAAALIVEDGRLRDARLASGRIATIPWRARAERILTGAPPTSDTFREAIAAELEPPIRTSDTRFKIGLNVRTGRRRRLVRPGAGAIQR